MVACMPMEIISQMSSNFVPLHDGKGDSIAAKNVVNENVSNVAVDKPLQELKTDSTGSKMVVKETFEKGKVIKEYVNSR